MCASTRLHLSGLHDGTVDIAAMLRQMAAKGFEGPVVVKQDPASD
jgi:sugar phosphate isomerase/epimerase